MSNNLNNKTFIITGGARGIGKAIASEFLKHSFSVVIVDILEPELSATVKELKTAGSDYNIRGYNADITNPEEVEKLKQQVFADCGPVYGLVNNAATFSVIAPLQEGNPQKWLSDIQVNLGGTFLMSHYFLPDLIQRKEGYVLNMISTGGVGDPHPYCTSYACSKAGVMRLTEGMAKELEESLVYVFGVAPPAVRTEMAEFIMSDKNGQKYRPGFEKFLQNSEDSASPEEVAKRVVELVTIKEAKVLSGRLIKVKENLEDLLKHADRIVGEDLRTLRITHKENF